MTPLQSGKISNLLQQYASSVADELIGVREVKEFVSETLAGIQSGSGSRWNSKDEISAFLSLLMQLFSDYQGCLEQSLERGGEAEADLTKVFAKYKRISKRIAGFGVRKATES